MRAIADVVRVMIDAVRDGKVINLNAVKNEAARRYGLKRSPKLVELIGAVPDEHRESLLPQLRAKPVRTASGIAVVAVMSKPHRCPHIATTETSASTARRTRQRFRVLHAVVHRVRAHEHARDTRAVRPVRSGARQGGPAAQVGSQR